MKISTYKTMLDKDTSQNILVTDKTFEYIGNDKLISPSEIVDFMKDVFNINECAEEYVYMIAFNTKMKILGVFEVGHGTVKEALISPRELFIRALLCGASSIILVHNHVSGDTEPSKEDLKVTKRIKEAGDLICIKLLDHIIIGNDFTSFSEKNFL